MHLDSREAVSKLRAAARPGDTLLVWGYRPDIFAGTRMLAGTPFLDSQPLTGVIADRHLTDSRPSEPDLAARNRKLLTRYRPSFIVDVLVPTTPRCPSRGMPTSRPGWRITKCSPLPGTACFTGSGPRRVALPHRRQGKICRADSWRKGFATSVQCGTFPVRAK